MLGTFVAVDVETANADFGSSCQIGWVTFTDSTPGGLWQSLIDPEDEFDSVNMSILGIDAAAVVGARRFADITPQLATLLAGKVVASHTSFDRVALARAHERYGLPPMEFRFGREVVDRHNLGAHEGIVVLTLAPHADGCVGHRHEPRARDLAATHGTLLGHRHTAALLLPPR